MKLEHAIQQHVEKPPLPLQGEILDHVLYLEQKTAGILLTTTSAEQIR
jgi:hypothetical protein